MDRRIPTLTLVLALTVPGPGASPARVAAPATAEPVGSASGDRAASGLQPSVDFLDQAPVIDGRLDDGLEHLPRRAFTTIARDPATNTTPEAHYRLGYGTGFFYLYLESRADSLTFRDRAYQNGDGFHMVIAEPQPDDAPTEEFYVLAGSAVREPRLEWSRRVFWYYNVDHLFMPTSDAARLEFAARDGHIAFELLLPWADVHPWHPWLSEAVGFNLAFVKAMPDGKDTYLVVPDGRIDSEQSPRRYARLAFAPPQVIGPAQAFLRLDRGHAAAGDLVSGAVALVAGRDSVAQRIALRVLAGEGSAVATQQIVYEGNPGLSVHAFELAASSLAPGGYRVRWQLEGGNSKGETGLTVLPRTSPRELLQRLEAATAARTTEPPPSPGGIATLRFLLHEIDQQLADTRPYETCAAVRIGLERLQQAVDAVEQGGDPIAAQRGLFRRAFVSQLDGALQPYAMVVPEDYDARRAYPLMVFLHGSGTDERALESFRSLVPPDWIGMAPRARGTSHAYATPEAQRDIVEALDDVQASYTIDPSRVVLAGFSMGGYGVLRTHFEHPGRFRALVVLSGHPAIAARFGFGDGQPDFCDPARLAPFKGVPVFLTHGQRDRNCPFELAAQLVDRLRGAGAQVEFGVDPARGHEAPAPAMLERLHLWLRDVVMAGR